MIYVKQYNQKKYCQHNLCDQSKHEEMILRSCDEYFKVAVYYPLYWSIQEASISMVYYLRSRN